jgi:hypothetical protein
MDSAVASTSPSLGIGTVLARINARLAMLRTWLSHDHHDEPYWWARRTTASRAQSERQVLRRVANLMHVERATTRGRIHGTRFATLDEQRAWLREIEDRKCPTAADLAGLPRDATLALLRAGKLPL